MTKNVLVVDGGGRGSALIKKYAESPHVVKLFAVPGNDLMPLISEKPVEIFPQVKTTDLKKILEITRKYKIDLVDVAQDDAIAAGLVDFLKSNKVKALGPTKSAGQIEWDKAWSRNFMNEFKIPCPQFAVFKNEKSGITYLKRQLSNSKWYVKASGLAAGKGAIYAPNINSAISAVKKMNNFGRAGETYLLEECLKGEEFSSFAAVSSNDFLLLGHAQDHKTVFENNTGPNTGGMGCSSPPLAVNQKIESQIKEIYKKTIDSLSKIKRPYFGILYLGGIITKNQKVKVIEFNARWGDPEAQVVIPAIKNDFYELALAIIDKNLSKVNIKKDNLYRIVVAAVSKGYPNDYSQVKGKKIIGLEKIISDRTVDFYPAAVLEENGNYLAAGGRLFYVGASGKNVVEARKKAYTALSKVEIAGGNLHMRGDIGYRDLKRTT